MQLFILHHCLLGFRLSASVLEVRNVSSLTACVDACFAHPCCRSMNYKHSTAVNQSNKCELLHNLVENSSQHTSHALEPNSSFGHFFFNQPLKVIRNITLCRKDQLKDSGLFCSEIVGERDSKYSLHASRGNLF